MNKMHHKPTCETHALGQFADEKNPGNLVELQGNMERIET